jgi:hypothetical protein
VQQQESGGRQDASHVVSSRFVGTTHEISKQCFKMGGVPYLLMGLFHHQGIAGVEITGKTGPVEIGETSSLLEPSRCMSHRCLHPSAA